MTTEEIVAKLKPWLTKHLRPAWKPVVEERADASKSKSKFGGIPYTTAEHDWPVCTECGQQMQHFLQLDLSDLPAELGDRHGTGLVQLFYCTRGDCQGMGGWFPFEDTMSRVRVLPIPLAEYVAPAEFESQEEEFSEFCIVDWEKSDDFPATAEQEELGLDFDYDFDSQPNLVKVKCPELQFESDYIVDPMLAENISSAQFGDKLSGWPLWVQNVEYPNCPRCQTRMIFLFQMDSEDNVPFGWGDAGTGHITQCPEHKDVVAFGWACG